MAKSIIVFDLDDTLSQSKMPLSPKMAELLNELLLIKKVAIISGCSIEQFKSQVVAYLSTDVAHLKNLYLFPENGSAMYEYKKLWAPLYSHNLTGEDKKLIIESFDTAIKESGIELGQSFGPRMEDRSGQITFSALGQHAPVELKREFDPDHSKRKMLQEKLSAMLPNFDVKIGGTTSIDVTLKGIDKAYAIGQIEKLLRIPREDILFIGDSIFPEGNDYSVVSTKVETRKVKGPDDTAKIILDILKQPVRR